MLSISKLGLQKRFTQHPVDEFNDLHCVESSKIDDYLISLGDYKYLIDEKGKHHQLWYIISSIK